MGKSWDATLPNPEIWVEALRVAKPGAHLLAFGGSRTFHRLVCAIEDAGWEVRDVLMWVYGSGFPKSLDVSKAMDKREGAEREPVGWYQRPDGQPRNVEQWKTVANADRNTYSPADQVATKRRSAPATDAARQWAGWGTALKPAYEPILLARKPLAGTVAGNVLAHGCGALNIDGCRVACEANDRTDRVGGTAPKFGTNTFATDRYSVNVKGSNSPASPDGRFPANFIHDGSPEVVALFPEMGLSSGRDSRGRVHQAFTDDARKSQRDDVHEGFGDSGSAARFFYTAKASQDDRDDGLEDFEKHSAGVVTGGRREGSAGLQSPRAGAGRTAGARNVHPTVKPTSLMRYLCRLITPPDGLILDPFAGSGSTGKAALLEGFRFVGIEQDPEYLAIAAARVRAAHEQPKQMELLADLPAPAPFIPRPAPSAQQIHLFEAAA